VGVGHFDNHGTVVIGVGLQGANGADQLPAPGDHLHLGCGGRGRGGGGGLRGRDRHKKQCNYKCNDQRRLNLVQDYLLVLGGTWLEFGWTRKNFSLALSATAL